jgi:hypothetical protein
MHVCRGSCPVLAACASWAVNLPTTDQNIIGGMTGSERVRIRRERQQAAQAQAQPWGMPVINSRKLSCDRGHDLSPGSPNLVMVRGRGGRLFRRCRECFRLRNRAAMRLSRSLSRAATAA